MPDRLIVTGLETHVSVSYRREGEDDAQQFGEPLPFEPPLSAQDLDDLAWYLERYLLAPYAVYAEKGAAIEGKLPDWGEALFASLFGPGLVARDAPDARLPTIIERTRVDLSSLKVNLEPGNGQAIYFRPGISRVTTPISMLSGSSIGRSRRLAL